MKPLSQKAVELLNKLGEAVDTYLKKADRVNEDWIGYTVLPDEQKKMAVEAINGFEAQLQAFFRSQQKECQKKLRNMPSYLKGRRLPRRIVTKAENPAVSVMERFVNYLGGLLFADETAAVDRMAVLYSAFSSSFFSQFSENVLGTIKGAKITAIDSLTATATKWLENHKIQFAREVQQTTHDAVVRCLRNALIDGDGITKTANDLMEALPGFFGQGTLKSLRSKLKGVSGADAFNALSKQIDSVSSFEFMRARRIAQHETITACNAATLEGYRQSGVVTKKEWMCACDERSRTDHIRADGQKVPIDRPFIVGGEKLMYPGDGSMGAAAKNVVGCRCTMRAVVEALDDDKRS